LIHFNALKNFIKEKTFIFNYFLPSILPPTTLQAALENKKFILCLVPKRHDYSISALLEVRTIPFQICNSI